MKSDALHAIAAKLARIEPAGADLAWAADVTHAHREQLPMWVVTKQPTDYPSGYVARLFLTLHHGPWQAGPTNAALFAAEIDPLREFLQLMGLVRLARDPNDEPQIVESWL